MFGRSKNVVHDCSSYKTDPPADLQQLFAKSCLMWAYLSQLPIAANSGNLVFYTVAVAPTIFTALPPQWSAAYVRKFFPRHFLFLGVTTTAAAALNFGAGTEPIEQAALMACASIFLFNCYWLTPRINKARDSSLAKTFKTLHWLSVGFNMLQLLVFVWLFLPQGQ